MVLRCGAEVFHYTRGVGGTETRLQALASIGIGGHIPARGRRANERPLSRGHGAEIREEIDLQSSYTERIVGLINDDSIAVGRVHLGIVHVFDLTEPKVRCLEEVLASGDFAPLVELRGQAQRFETWSQFLLENDGILCPAVFR